MLVLAIYRTCIPGHVAGKIAISSLIVNEWVPRRRPVTISGVGSDTGNRAHPATIGPNFSHGPCGNNCHQAAAREFGQSLPDRHPWLPQSP